MILKNSLFICIALLLLSCGSSKKITTIDTSPNWVKAKPINSMYYIGVGSAIKSLGSTEHQQNAKNDALADLSSEISVNISTSSALHQLENSFGYSEDFMASTFATSKEHLEGYELVNTYESETHYWVYYKLSKSKYAELKKVRRDNSVKQGLDYYQKARKNKQENNYLNALTFYLKGLESVKDYFTESLQIDYQGEEILLGNELLTGFITAINEISILPKHAEILVKQNESISSDKLSFLFQTASGAPLSNLPVEFTLGNKPLHNSLTETNYNGEATYSLGAIKIKQGSRYFEVKLDIESIAKQAINDPFFRRMTRKIDVPKSQIKINIDTPKFFVSSVEKNLNNNITPKRIQQKINQLLSNNDFVVVFKEENADYKISISLYTEKWQREGRMYYTLLKGDVKVLNSENQMILFTPMDDIQGVQLNYRDAGMDAYNNLIEKLDRTFIHNLKQSIL